MRIILKYLGYLLLIAAVLRIVPIIAALIYKEDLTLQIISIAIQLILGLALISVRPNKEEFTLTRAFILISLSFITLSLIGSISFIEIFDWNFTNAFFESVSGFTTTGLTVMQNFEDVPRNLLLWRAETQWIGGIGIVVMFLFLINLLKSGSSTKDVTIRSRSIAHLYHANAAIHKPEGTPRQAIISTIVIYTIYTAAGFILLFLTGLTSFVHLFNGQARIMIHDRIHTGGALWGLNRLRGLLVGARFIAPAAIPYRRARVR